MSLILSGTDGLSDVDGTAATPAIRGTDANTGIFFPAADTIAFSEGGTEAMRIDSSGNLGLGVTPTGWSGLTAMQIGQAASIFAQSGGNFIGGYVGSNIYYNGGWKYIRNGYATKYSFNETNNGQHQWWIAPDNTSGAGAAATETQAMTLTAAGDLTIGATSSGGYRLRIVSSGTNGISCTTLASTTSNPSQDWFDSTNNTEAILSCSSGQIDFGAYSNSPLVLRTNNTERVRIDTSGNLQFNSGYGSVATAYGCRAWVNFGYVSSAITVRASGNVSSVTRASAGNYFVNFSTSMPDANYAVSVTASISDGVDGGAFANGTNQSTSACQINTLADVAFCQVMVVR